MTKKRAVKRPPKKPAKRAVKKPTSRMREYITRQKERGLTNVCVWVPKKYTYDIRKAADDMRRSVGIETPRSVALYGESDD